jgi:UDP-N-acetylglucosamine--N-acetylmuramyl-(pentapeptide) pyrophosphoryl-undecaprenol N-acetylglucosamine transferase
LCRRPLIIHEQNAIAGLSNRLLSRFASRVLQAFPATFASHCSAVTTGNPVRAAIAALAPPRARAISAAPPRVLVFGGSQGARALNMIVPQALATAGVAELRVLHQCGTHEVESTRARYAELGLGERVEVVRFIDDMAAAYSAADLVVARAGASTIAEITACGVAAIVVPYPHAVDDHQSANARQLERAHAAVVIAERDLDVARLSAEFARLLGDRDARLALAERARELGHPQASVKVAQFCLDYLDA